MSERDGEGGIEESEEGAKGRRAAVRQESPVTSVTKSNVASSATGE
jgi:hypothetical protein